jgi:hypothetical protein
MKKTLIALSALSLSLSSIAFAHDLQGWSGQGESVLLNSDGSAEIQTACGFISIKHWNDQGQAMDGEASSALPGPEKQFTHVDVTAVLEEDGSLDLRIGDGSTYVLHEGYETSVICG